MREYMGTISVRNFTLPGRWFNRTVLELLLTQWNTNSISLFSITSKLSTDLNYITFIGCTIIPCRMFSHLSSKRNSKYFRWIMELQDLKEVLLQVSGTGDGRVTNSQRRWARSGNGGAFRKLLLSIQTMLFSHYPTTHCM